MREKKIEPAFCQPFLNFAHVQSVEAIKSDLGESVKRVDDGWKVLEERRKKFQRNVKVRQEVAKERAKLVTDFLKAIYEYFEKYEINPDEYATRRYEKLKLIGFMRLLRPDQLNQITT
ncbi:MAG: hypothetical protein HeimC3_30560 [Candidatus Heimdallarchaeota archaeon LC_3]|nr:MAG: hypothetical protein HeimC3_30560 [Candidatus Heimdallarchaeota archaeon LC_3]